jgi:hypothetical protein
MSFVLSVSVQRITEEGFRETLKVFWSPRACSQVPLLAFVILRIQPLQD